jgi:AcrR family transcriptional regulator
MDLDALSIIEIAKAARCSVGAFYVRFENKDAFFRALVAHMISERRDALVAFYERTPDAVILTAVVEDHVAFFRQHAGLLRSALRKGVEEASFWEPVWRQGQVASNLLVDRLRRVVGRDLRPEEEMRIRFALQIVSGTLVNALLHQPGPLSLESELIESELARVFQQTIGLEKWPR